MSDLSRHISNSLNSTMVLVYWLVGMGLIIYSFSGVYSVSPEDIAVHTRFGQVIDGKVLPGIHFGLPYPFDKIYRVPVKRMKTIRVDDFAGKESEVETNEFFLLTGISTYCITGDNNIVTISCIGQYTVEDASQYLFQTVSAESILREVTKNGIIHCLSGMPVDAILTTGKKDIAEFVKSWVNRKLADCGLKVQFLELKSVSPPALVQENFQDVIKAGIDRKKMLNDAEGYQNQRLSLAAAEAEQLIQEGMAYKTEKVAKANGAAERFLKKLSEFEKNPQLVYQKEFFDFFQVLGRRWPNNIILNTVNGKPPVNLRLAWPQ